MGFNTTIVILNDGLDQIEKDPEFGKNLVAAIRALDVRKDRNKPIYVSAGNHSNPCSVIETHHADYNVLVKVGGNTGTVVHTDDDYNVKLARKIADQITSKKTKTELALWHEVVNSVITTLEENR